jgi:hypothetical protein
MIQFVHFIFFIYAHIYSLFPFLFGLFRHNISLPKSDYILPHYSRSNIFKNQNWTNPEYRPRLYQD